MAGDLPLAERIKSFEEVKKMSLKNNYPEQEKTHERQNGGNTPVTGERHQQKKAQYVTENQRAGLIDNAGLENSPGRKSADVRSK